MRKFRLDQNVWIHQEGEQPLIPGVVRTFAGESGMFDTYGVQVGETPWIMAFKESDLSARSMVERIGGLAKVRKEMEIAEEEAEMIADAALYQECLGIPDDELTPEQLQEKYDKASDWDDHPLFPMAQWRQEVSDCRTRVGYWEWVSYCLNE